MDTLDSDTATTVSFMPRYLRGFAWRDSSGVSSRTAHYTEIDDPLPRPPPSEFENVAAMQTIAEHPELFCVATPIQFDVLAYLCRDHPNRPFVDSVIIALRDGFWPWASTKHADGYPITWDDAMIFPPSDRERQFINDQRDIEIAKGRFSPCFGPDLLPGMYSTPVLAVPKPHSDDLRLCSHQSFGRFSQNSMIDKTATKGPRMDTLHQFIPALLRFRRQHPDVELVMFKSDVSEAFRHTPMHPLFQIKQVVTTNLPTKSELASDTTPGPLIRTVDWCSSFGGCGSPRSWASVMGLVIWIAIFVKLIHDLFCYVDDAYSWDLAGEMLFYPPYNKSFPRKQTQLLLLWDELGIPHKEKKQLFGPTLTVIGFEIDPNAMTATMPSESKDEMIAAVREFIASPSRRRTLNEWQKLAGWINWSFNVFPLLRPCLCHVYLKMGGKSNQLAPIYLNKEVCADLQWFIGHVEQSSGILFHLWHPKGYTQEVNSPDIWVDPWR